MAQTFLRNVWRDFKIPVSALAMVARKSFNGRFHCKNWFSDGTLYVTIADADIGSLKSLHTLFDENLDNMLVKFKQNCILRTIQNFAF